MWSELFESLSAFVSSVGTATIWRSFMEVGRIMVAAFGFLAFLILGIIGALFMPPKAKSK